MRENKMHISNFCTHFTPLHLILLPFSILVTQFSHYSLIFLCHYMLWGVATADCCRWARFIYLLQPWARVRPLEPVVNKFLSRQNVIISPNLISNVSACWLMTSDLQGFIWTAICILKPAQLRSISCHCAHQCATAHFSWKMPGVVLVLVGFTQRLQSLPGMHFSGLHRIECYFQLVCCSE